MEDAEKVEIAYRCLDRTRPKFCYLTEKVQSKSIEPIPIVIDSFQLKNLRQLNVISVAKKDAVAVSEKKPYAQRITKIPLELSSSMVQARVPAQVEPLNLHTLPPEPIMTKELGILEAEPVITIGKIALSEVAEESFKSFTSPQNNVPKMKSDGTKNVRGVPEYETLSSGFYIRSVFCNL